MRDLYRRPKESDRRCTKMMGVGGCGDDEDDDYGVDDDVVVDDDDDAAAAAAAVGER